MWYIDVILYLKIVKDMVKIKSFWDKFKCKNYWIGNSYGYLKISLI